jgi:hypothetical protein
MQEAWIVMTTDAKLEEILFGGQKQVRFGLMLK